MSKWGGRRAQAWTAAVLAEYGTSCWLQLPGCTTLATTGDHILPRSTHPELQYLVANGRPACEACNKRRKATPYQLVLTARALVQELDASRFFEGDPHPGRTPSPDSPPDLR